MEGQVKRCPSCGETKAAEGFGKSKKSKDGLGSRCKTCNKVYMQEWNQENKEKIRSKQRASYIENHEERRAKSNAYYRANITERRAKAKEFRERYRGYAESLMSPPGACHDCGATESLGSKSGLQFHHLSGDGHREVNSRWWAKAARDDPDEFIERVVLLCRQCHGKRHRLEAQKSTEQRLREEIDCLKTHINTLERKIA